MLIIRVAKNVKSGSLPWDIPLDFRIWRRVKKSPLGG